MSHRAATPPCGGQQGGAGGDCGVAFAVRSAGVIRTLVLGRLMFVAVSSLRAAPTHAAALEARFASRQKLVDRHDGFRRLQLLKGRGTGEYLLVLEWEDFDSFRAYVKSRDFEHAHVELDEGIAANPLRVYDIIVDSLNGG